VKSLLFVGYQISWF